MTARKIPVAMPKTEEEARKLLLELDVRVRRTRTVAKTKVSFSMRTEYSRLRQRLCRAFGYSTTSLPPGRGGLRSSYWRLPEEGIVVIDEFKGDVILTFQAIDKAVTV
jgi:hypothetical protein